MVSRRRAPDGLTKFEREICHAVDSGLSGREAYRAVRPQSKASDRTAEHYIWRVRHRPHCAAYLKTLQAKSLARHPHRKDRIIEELALFAFSDICDLVTWGPDGLAVKRLDQLPPAQRRALSRISISKSAHGGTIRLAMHDKLSALDKLCRMFGLYEQAGVDGGDAAPDPALSDVERAQRLAAILRLGETEETPMAEAEI